MLPILATISSIVILKLLSRQFTHIHLLAPIALIILPVFAMSTAIAISVDKIKLPLDTKLYIFLELVLCLIAYYFYIVYFIRGWK